MLEEIKEAIKTKTGRMFFILEVLTVLTVLYIGILALMMIYFAMEVI